MAVGDVILVDDVGSLTFPTAYPAVPTAVQAWLSAQGVEGVAWSSSMATTGARLEP
jgi:hypothetical protein